MMIRWLLILVMANHLGTVFANCQYEIFKKCNHALGQSYREDRESWVTDMTVENCKALQAIVGCVEKNTHCSGDFLDEFRFALYSAAVIGKKISCPDLKYDVLKNMIQGVKSKMGVPDMEPLPVNDCAKTLFRDCYLMKFRREMETHRNACRDADDMVSCFENESHTCNSALLEAYIKVLVKHAEHLTHIAEENKTDIEMCSS